MRLQASEALMSFTAVAEIAVGAASLADLLPRVVLIVAFVCDGQPCGLCSLLLLSAGEDLAGQFLERVLNFLIPISDLNHVDLINLRVKIA